MPILKTRLYKPSVSDNFIVRDELIAHLNSENARPLKLIVAGAGYGKSILMSQWLDNSHKKYCWISLEEDCNDLQVFLSYMVAGIQQNFPESMQRTAQISANSIMPSDQAIAQTFNNELQDLSESIIIVLDDFHVIRNSTLFNLFNEILKFPPENVQIAIVSRIDPPLNKSRLVAYQQVTEIRMSDLRLSIDEVKELAKCSFQMDISKETAKKIEKITEGWALSVYLKIKEFAMSNSVEMGKYGNYQTSNNLSPFLFNLLEASLPDEAVKLVLVISLFDRVNRGLIEQLFKNTEETDLKGINLNRALLKIDELDSPFLISLDENTKWFRMHHLIKEILSKRLFQTCPASEIEGYYKAAGEYFADQQYFEEGIRFSILGKNDQKAVEIIQNNWEKLMNYGQNLTLKRWIQMLPADLSESDPVLLIIKAYLCDTSADFISMAKYLEQASKRIDKQSADPRLLGAFASVHSALSCYTNNPSESLDYANQALNNLSQDQDFLLDYAQNFKVIALNSIESYQSAKAFLVDRRSTLNPDNRLRLMRLHVIQMFIDWYQGRLSDLKFSCPMVIEICKEEKVWWFYRVGHYYLGQLFYMKNETNKVYEYIDQGIDCAFNSSPIWAFHLYYTGALTALADNDVSKAQAYVEAVKQLIRTNNIPEYEGYISAFEVEVALRTNDINRAWKLNQTSSYDLHPPIYYYFIPQFTQIKLYMLRGNEQLLREAGEMINDIKGDITRANNRHALIQLTLLEAIWHDNMQDKASAMDSIREAISLVYDPDYIRVFLDFGRPICELFGSLSNAEKKLPLVRNILNAYLYEIESEEPLTSIHPLTLKELELMELVEKGLQNKEIADEMCLSESTIKTYLYRVYQKLDVSNRTSALLRMKEI